MTHDFTHNPLIIRLVDPKIGSIIKSIVFVGSLEDDMINELKKPSKTTFNTIRQLIADNNISSFDDLYKHLYDNTAEYAVGCEGQVAIILNECIYQSNFKIDFEINFMSCISRIIDTVKTNKIL